MSADFSTQSTATPAEPASLPVTPAVAGTEDRTIAILAYCTGLGFIVALVLFSTGKKSALGAFHLRQGLGLFLASFAFGLAGIVLAMIPFIGWLTLMLGWIALLVLVVLGFIAAINGKQQPVPVIGETIQRLLAGAFVV